MLRRLFLRGAAGGAAAVAATSYTAQGVRAERYVNPMALPMRDVVAHTGGSSLGNAASPKLFQLAQKELLKQRGSNHRRRLYQDGVYYCDIQEWKSVSPAAKRVISVDRYLRRQEEDRSLYVTVMRSFGLEPVEDEHPNF